MGRVVARKRILVVFFGRKRMLVVFFGHFVGQGAKYVE
jgi:hypothetical protein